MHVTFVVHVDAYKSIAAGCQSSEALTFQVSGRVSGLGNVSFL